MAGPTIKEYMIKITADVKDVEAALNKLASNKAINKLDFKLDAAVTRELQRIQGTIGTVTEEIAKLRNAPSFDFGDDIKKMADDFTNAVNRMSDAFDGFQNTFADFSGKDGSGFGKVFTDFTEQMKQVIDSYKTTMSLIENVGSGAINGDAIVNAFQGITEKTKTETTKMTTTLKKAKKDLEDAIIGVDLRGIYKALDSQGEVSYSNLSKYLAQLDNVLKQIDVLNKQNIQGLNINSIYIF